MLRQSAARQKVASSARSTFTDIASFVDFGPSKLVQDPRSDEIFLVENNPFLRIS
eukprot:m.651129 g.651129  ORF g.651129 m.651129 type:complete len:55 (-) comp58398_c0_seq14:1915-2079(-)